MVEVARRRTIAKQKCLTKCMSMSNKNIKAVFLDMDDTLVLTSECDNLAFVKVSALALELQPDVNTDDLIQGFRKGMKDTPWDKDYKVGHGLALSVTVTVHVHVHEKERERDID